MNAMKCEYCGSMIKTVPDNGICPNCGCTLKSERPKPPFPMVEARGGFIELRDKWIRLCVKQPKVPRIDITIPYDQIYDVSYVPANWWHYGFICVREKRNQHIPLPERFGQQRLGDTFAFIEEKNNDKFRQVYVFLKANIGTGEELGR
ncbi:MAG: hypothetical protein IJO45_04895 [Oscillospiraceae bacterium]|nr:hypothetical protein [Oscillospiraceae bacterium]